MTENNPPMESVDRSHRSHLRQEPRSDSSSPTPLRPEEAGSLIAKLGPEILASWEDAVRLEVPAARRQDRLVLFDEIPLFLARVAQTLTGELELRGHDVCREHGEQRALEASYPIDDVIEEYRILRKTICKLLEREAPLSVEAREMVTDVIELAMQDAAERYVDVQHRGLIEADKRKDQFVATVAHELRTPLSAVTNALFLLENVELDERSMRHLQVANRQTHQLRRLIEDIMDLNRITHNKLEIRREPVSINTLLRSAVESVRPSIEARGQDIHLALPGSDFQLMGDPVRLEQVLVNLLNNANRFTPAGGSIWVDVEPEASAVVLRVRDSGTGIPSVMLPQIFDLFVQAGASDHSESRGLGIGLALVKRLVSLHGGEVTARSHGEGLGSEFEVRLPLSSSAEFPLQA